MTDVLEGKLQPGKSLGVISLSLSKIPADQRRQVEETETEVK